MDKKDYYLYVKGKAVKVSEEVYKAYWKITEHEKYLQRKDWKHNVIQFSALDHNMNEKTQNEEQPINGRAND